MKIKVYAISFILMISSRVFSQVIPILTENPLLGLEKNRFYDSSTLNCLSKGINFVKEKSTFCYSFTNGLLDGSVITIDSLGDTIRNTKYKNGEVINSTIRYENRLLKETAICPDFQDSILVNKLIFFLQRGDVDSFVKIANRERSFSLIYKRSLEEIVFFLGKPLSYKLKKIKKTAFSNDTSLDFCLSILYEKDSLDLSYKLIKKIVTFII